MQHAGGLELAAGRTEAGFSPEFMIQYMLTAVPFSPFIVASSSLILLKGDLVLAAGRTEAGFSSEVIMQYVLTAVPVVILSPSSCLTLAKKDRSCASCMAGQGWV